MYVLTYKRGRGKGEEQAKERGIGKVDRGKQMRKGETNETGRDK